MQASKTKFELITGYFIIDIWNYIAIKLTVLHNAINGEKMKNGIQQSINTPTTIDNVRAALCSCTYFIICLDFSLTPTFFFMAPELAFEAGTIQEEISLDSSWKDFSKSMDQINFKVLTVGRTVTILLVLSNRGGFAWPFLMDDDLWPLGIP